MYSILKDNTEIAYADNLVHIYLQKNGCFGACSEEKAQGIAADGVPYQLEGREIMDIEKMEGIAPGQTIETVTYEVFSGAQRIEGSMEEAISILSGEISE